ncbi:uncharacterized protein LOC129576655 [Sitodiplosis mosellana]|uniref:uncharacterized protein LOC129576655 n=1 Tax=Sitodiplosis mosellana TaxID=263140 RepID=UPI00244512FE|nr:uncharacterized protein LOC129576655 [Sitodiplosis mosellana]
MGHKFSAILIFLVGYSSAASVHLLSNSLTTDEFQNTVTTHGSFKDRATDTTTSTSTTPVDIHHQRSTINLTQTLQGNQSEAVCKINEKPLNLLEIKQMHTFLEKSLKKNVLNYTLSPVTKPGDNYNFMLQSLEVKLLQNDSFEIDTLKLVCKTPAGVSISSSHSKQFSNEMHFYSVIVPAIELFEQNANVPKTERIDAFVRYFGARLSLDSNVESADGDAVILLENAKSLNFACLGRRDKFDKEQVLAILKRLAKLHALTIAMRRLEPTMFYSKVDPHLHTRYNGSFLETLINITDKFANKLPITFPNMTIETQNTIKTQLNNSKEYLRNRSISSAPDTPYTTFYHRDLWVKNIMIKKGGHSKQSIQVKILDFQAYDYDSFAFDLTFFVFYNAQIEDLQMNFKLFIEYYHSEFFNTMRLVDCSIDDYTYEKMWHEIKDKAKLNLLKLYLYLAFDQIEILKNNEVAANGTDFYLDQPTPEIILNRWKCINDLYIENGFI